MGRAEEVAELSGLEEPGGPVVRVPRMCEEAEEGTRGGIRLGRIKKDGQSC